MLKFMRLPYKIRNAIWLHKSYEIRHQNRRDLLIARDETRRDETREERERDETRHDVLASFFFFKNKAKMSEKLAAAIC